MKQDDENSVELDEEMLEETLEETMKEDDQNDDQPDVSEDESSKVKEVEERYMYLFAEYENFRKRTQKEKEDLYQNAVVDVTKNWLSVLDNIERALDAANKLAAEDGKKDSSEDKMLQGLELIKKQAIDVLSKINVREIECERGTTFDPNLHEAVMHIDDDSLGENQIASVFQKGYICKDTVVRHAVVQVAN